MNPELEQQIKDLIQSELRSTGGVVPHHVHNGIDSANVTESSIRFSDNTTGDSTTTQHGFLPKLSGTSTTFLNGAGAFSTPTTTVSLKSYTTASNTNSITITGLNLGTDLQYQVIARYGNGGSAVGVENEQRLKINNDTGSNYSYAYRQYSNSGGGTATDAAVNATTVIKMETNASVDSEGIITLWFGNIGGNNVAINWQLYARDPGATVMNTSTGGGIYLGSANMTQIEIGALGDTSTKQWYVSVYKFSTT